MRIVLPVLTLLLGSLSACGGGSPASPSPTPGNPHTITITGTGVSPKELNVPQGTRVLFVNNGNRTRDMGSDPHPEHDQCPELNVGRLAPGQSRETGNLNTIRTCGFHDHDDPTNTSVQGRIVIRQ